MNAVHSSCRSQRSVPYQSRLAYSTRSPLQVIQLLRSRDVSDRPPAPEASPTRPNGVPSSTGLSITLRKTTNSERRHRPLQLESVLGDVSLADLATSGTAIPTIDRPTRLVREGTDLDTSQEQEVAFDRNVSWHTVCLDEHEPRTQDRGQ
jgi:hypothetical protein